jgi:hypothetical protein
LEILCQTESLSKDVFNKLYAEYEELGAKLYKFRETVAKKHNIFEKEQVLLS